MKPRLVLLVMAVLLAGQDAVGALTVVGIFAGCFGLVQLHQWRRGRR